MATTMEIGASMAFGERILAPPTTGNSGAGPWHPVAAKLLEEAATTTALRLGRAGMEDVSYREFVDLVSAISATPNSSHSSNDNSDADLSLLIETDTSPDHRNSSVLRGVYFSFLANAGREDPPTASMVDRHHDANKSDECPAPRNRFSRCCRTVSSTSSTTASSWSAISAPDTTEGLPRTTTAWEDERAGAWFPETATPLAAANDCGVDPSIHAAIAEIQLGSSFHFVSQFDDDDDDDDETLSEVNDDDDDEAMTEDDDTAIANNNGRDDSSMVVFVERNEGWHHPRNHTLSPSRTEEPPNDPAMELPHDFEVVTIVSTPGARDRTYSVTTTASSGRRSDRPSTTPAVEATEKPLRIQPSGRSRSDGGASTSKSLSNKFRKLMSFRSKSMGSF